MRKYISGKIVARINLYATLLHTHVKFEQFRLVSLKDIFHFVKSL